MGDYIIRDFIPAGEKLNPAEKMRRARSTDPYGARPDYVPDEGIGEFVDKTPEEKSAHAAELAAGEPERQHYKEREAAKRKLSKMSVPNAVSFIQELPSYHREVYLEAEYRPEVLKHFPGAVQRTFEPDAFKALEAAAGEDAPEGDAPDIAIKKRAARKPAAKDA